MLIYKRRKSLNRLLVLVVLLGGNGLYAQDANDRSYIKNLTNLEALRNIVNTQNTLVGRAMDRAARTSIPESRYNEFGQLGVLYAFDEKGSPIYAYDDEIFYSEGVENINAARTGRTDRLWSGGSLGLNLTGAGIEIAVWESGGARTTHQEFGGRASIADDASITSHATHTGGTLIATGVDANARGMASGATIKNYTASGMPSEAAAFAAAGGILANNSNSPSGTAGVYDNNARNMDNVTYNAPFYLHVKSAGNNGSPYVSIYGNQLAKNLLVVANANDVPNYTGPSSVTMSSSSSYGPPNDWRIKPDITNNGVSVYSSDSGSDTDYGTKSGTSMSTPATAGTVALLQQYYKNLNGVYMRAATARALIINTADEVGSHDGPDFRSGWGLVNAERAALMIGNSSAGNTSLMDELTLNDGGTYIRTIESDGSTPLQLTIAWNDPAGATSSSNNPVLVNDLDVRVTGNGNTYSPWIMVPNASYNNYTDPAQRGDNFRDNVEKIDAVLPAGTYTVTVTHKGTLTSGSQDFSMVIDGITVNTTPDTEAPSIPNGLTASNITYTGFTLNWNASTDNRGVVSYEVFQDGGSIGSFTSTEAVITGLVANTTYSYTLTARDGAGNVSGNSSPLTVTTLLTPACSGITSFPYIESFDGNVGVWIQESSDDINWTFDTNSTPSSNTGPSGPTDGSSYIYTEATGNGTGFPGKLASLTSPCIDLSGLGNAELTFDYHMYGAAMGTLEFLVSTDDGVTWNTLWTRTGNQGNQWISESVSLLSYAGSVIQLQINGTTGSSFTSDMAIDDLRINELIVDTDAPSVPTNLSVANLSNIGFTLSWDAATDNVGVTEYEVYQNGSSIGVFSTTDAAITGLSATTTYSYTVTARDAAGNVSVNSAPLSITTLDTPPCDGINNLPYTESFDGNVGLWTQASSDDINWSFDTNTTTSSSTGPAGPTDGSHYIYTEASGNGTGYPNKVAELTSSCIDLSGHSGAELRFDYHMYGSNMGTLEMRASTDDGVTWSTIWSETGNQGNQWFSQTINLAGYVGTVLNLQIRGTTGSSFRSDMAIDNLRIVSLGINSNDSDDTDGAQDSFESVTITTYPNPFSGRLNVRYGEEWTGGELDILSLSGSRLYHKALSGSGRIELSGLDLKSGIYILKISKENDVFTRKIISK